jgi:hypothetical protein
MATVTQTNVKQRSGKRSPQKFVKFRVPEELWERLNIAKIKGRTNLEQMCTEAIERYLNKVMPADKAGESPRTNSTLSRSSSDHVA